MFVIGFSCAVVAVMAKIADYSFLRAGNCEASRFFWALYGF
jgi:hypothetical protein